MGPTHSLSIRGTHKCLGLHIYLMHLCHLYLPSESRGQLCILLAPHTASASGVQFLCPPPSPLPPFPCLFCLSSCSLWATVLSGYIPPPVMSLGPWFSALHFIEDPGFLPASASPVHSRTTCSCHLAISHSYPTSLELCAWIFTSPSALLYKALHWCSAI